MPPPLVSDTLSVLFNAILHHHFIPSSFCPSLVIPIFKGGNKDSSIPSNYRGISLSSNLSKLFERLLLQVLQSKLLPLIHPLQGGFRPGYSTTHMSYLVGEVVSAGKAKKCPTYLALLDVQKAFDTVWHDGLFLKLYNHGIKGDIWFTLFNWYNRLQSSVVWEGSVSRQFAIKQGVRQGAVLSPLLYAIFTNDLLFDLERSGMGVYIGPFFCGAVTFADDLCLAALSPIVLQRMIDIVMEFANRWRYSINPLKSNILISNSGRSSYDTPFTWLVGNTPVPLVHSAKHLGILLSSNSSTMDRTLGAISASRSAYYALTAVGARHTCMSPATSIHLYKSPLCYLVLRSGIPPLQQK